MKPSAFRIDADDNVATLLEAAGPGAIPLGGAGDGGTVTLLERIGLGHKVALEDIAAGAIIRKFGVAIGAAISPIPRGAWVHLHNCRSGYDARSGGFDVHTGVATDMVYE